MILYCFISHNRAVEKDYGRISNMMQNLSCEYRIFYGGPKFLENENIIHLDCDDTYIGLSDKTNKLCRYINSNIDTNYIIKLDRSIEILDPIDETSLKHDYMGKTLKFINRYFHFNKTPINSKWYNKAFDGPEIKYCDGGSGYILSKKSVTIIANDDSQKDFPYEDYYVGYILKKYDILPKCMHMENFFYDNRSHDDVKL